MYTRSPLGRICIVANELPHLFRNGGIGTHNWMLAEGLAAAGWNVHVLYSAQVDDEAKLKHCRRLWNAKGITLWQIAEFGSPSEDAVNCGLLGWFDWQSLRVRRALEQLHASHHFDLIEFAEYLGTGFRTVQARRMGAAFADTRIIVKLHSSSQWCRDGNRQWLVGSDDLIRDYYERYSFEHADHQLSPSQYMLSYASSIGWNVRSDARVVPYCYPAPSVSVHRQDGERIELVFFGRLEQRKGLKLFLDMAQALPADVGVSFLGRELPVDGMPATQLIAKILGERSYAVHTAFDRDQALDYLSQGNRIAIIPSLVENYPFTVLECAVNGIPFLAGNVGGIPEIVSDPELQQAILFEPTLRALREQVERYLATDPATRAYYAERMQDRCNIERNHATVCRAYLDVLRHAPSPSIARPVHQEVSGSGQVVRQAEAAVVHDEPLVSIVVPYYNMGEYLPDTLESLAAQDYANTEVIVVNDGSTDTSSLEVLEQMQARYPHFRFLTQDNRGLGGARNGGLAVAQGEFFLPVDADNIARPDMVRRFVQALKRNRDISVATCYFLAFEQKSDIAERKFLYAYRPCGGPLVAAALRNVFGDANAMSRTAALRAVGGYETDKDTTCEDWEMYVKLVRRGHRVDVVPDYLFYYRHRAESLLRTTDLYMNRRRVLRQFFPAGDLPHAEQIELWTALVGFDEGQRQLRHPPAIAPNPKKPRSVPRRVAREVKRIIRKAPYYSTVSDTLKRFKKRAA